MECPHRTELENEGRISACRVHRGPKIAKEKRCQNDYKFFCSKNRILKPSESKDKNFHKNPERKLKTAVALHKDNHGLTAAEAEMQYIKYEQ